jgi:ribosomal subunit interface protein
LHVYIAARHVEQSEAIKQYIETHLIEPIRSHSRINVTRVEVQLFAEGDKANQFGCHVLVSVKGDHDINVREVDSTLYAAIDVAKDRVLRRLTELRDRMLTMSRHPHKYNLEKLGRALGFLRKRNPA